MVKKYLLSILIFLFSFSLTVGVFASTKTLYRDLDRLEETINGLARILKINLPGVTEDSTTEENNTFNLKNVNGFTFTKNLKQGDRGSDVKWLQIVLNADTATVVAQTGVGSSGNESDYFGPATVNAVKRFQQKYKEEVLAPVGITYPNGFVGELTRKKLNAILSGDFTIVPSDPPTVPVAPASSSSTEEGVGKAPSAPSVYNITKGNVTVSGGDSTEVRLGNTGSWYTSPYTFSGLEEKTTYIAYARYKATSSSSFSKTSTGTVFQTAISNPCKSQKNYTDSRNKKTYTLVETESQCWMAENLNYDIEGSWCYNNVSSNCTKYGRLYAFEVAKTACPSGWRLPTDNDFKILETQIGMGIEEIDRTGWRGEDVGTILKSKSGWDGSNEKSFNALPAGGREESGSFSGLEQGISFWTSTESGNFAWIRNLYTGFTGINRALFPKENAISIRCIREI
jgi:uncharacterized protein (TIGR02145 family)